jgi:glutamine amidotransferase
MICIVDYGVGNLKSLKNAFQFLGFQSKCTSSEDEILSAEKLVLPGVGAFAYAMQNIRRLKLEDALLQKANQGTPILGICLGMQLLFTGSQEGGSHFGLDLIPGMVVKITGALKVPHMGWNQIIKTKPARLLKGLSSTGYGYFVHSYYCEPEDRDIITATTEYGSTFASVVEKGLVFGVQFHPEKSQELGLTILKNFAEL